MDYGWFVRSFVNGASGEASGLGGFHRFQV